MSGDFRCDRATIENVSAAFGDPAIGFGESGVLEDFSFGRCSAKPAYFLSDWALRAQPAAMTAETGKPLRA